MSDKFVSNNITFWHDFSHESSHFRDDFLFLPNLIYPLSDCYVQYE